MSVQPDAAGAETPWATPGFPGPVAQAVGAASVEPIRPTEYCMEAAPLGLLAPQVTWIAPEDPVRVTCTPPSVSLGGPTVVAGDEEVLRQSALLRTIAPLVAYTVATYCAFATSDPPAVVVTEVVEAPMVVVKSTWGPVIRTV